MSGASDDLDGNADMDVSDHSGGGTSGGDKSPGSDTRRLTVCPPVEIARRLQFTLAGSISCPVYPTTSAKTIIETENLSLHLSEEHAAIFNNWSKYVFENDLTKDNIILNRVAGKISNFKDGIPDGYAPTLATVYLSKVQVSKQPHKNNLMATEEAHKIMAKAEKTDPIIHRITAHVNEKIQYSEQLFDDGGYYVSEDPTFNFVKYSKLNFLDNEQYFKTFRMTPTAFYVKAYRKYDGSVYLDVEPEAGSESVPLSGASHLSPGRPTLSLNRESTDVDSPQTLSRLDQVDGSSDDEEKGEKSKKRKESQAPDWHANILREAQEEADPSLAAAAAEESRLRAEKFRKLAEDIIRQNDLETRRWKIIQEKEAAIRKEKKSIRQITKELENLGRQVMTTRRDDQMRKKQERLEKAKERRDRQQAELAILKKNPSTKPFQRQATIEDTIPFHSPKKVPSAAAGSDPNPGAAAAAAASGLFEADPSAGPSQPRRPVQEYDQVQQGHSQSAASDLSGIRRIRNYPDDEGISIVSRPESLDSLSTTPPSTISLVRTEAFVRPASIQRERVLHDLRNDMGERGDWDPYIQRTRRMATMSAILAGIETESEISSFSVPEDTERKDRAARRHALKQTEKPDQSLGTSTRAMKRNILSSQQAGTDEEEREPPAYKRTFYEDLLHSDNVLNYEPTSEESAQETSPRAPVFQRLGQRVTYATSSVTTLPVNQEDSFRTANDVTLPSEFEYDSEENMGDERGGAQEED